MKYKLCDSGLAYGSHCITSLEYVFFEDFTREIKHLNMQFVGTWMS